MGNRFCCCSLVEARRELRDGGDALRVIDAARPAEPYFGSQDLSGIAPNATM